MSKPKIMKSMANQQIQFSYKFNIYDMILSLELFYYFDDNDKLLTKSP